MFTTVSDHYANLLAPIYSWMVGDFDAACAAADAFYANLGLSAGEGRIAVDLGCGHGVHTIPLAQRGYRVLAIDTSEILLDELQRRVDDLPITPLHNDLLKFPAHLKEDASLIICMGDTLTHLPTFDDVTALIHDAAERLLPDGVFAVSLRDYASHEWAGADRFIPVRADDHRIHTCFLDYRSDQVLVHDIVHTRSDAGWQTSVSAYPKLRLPLDRLLATAQAKGLALIHRSETRGMHYLAFSSCSGENAC